MVSLDNTILILDSNKAYLYSFKPSCSKLETNSLIIKKSSVINCGYIVALFENGIVCIYSKNFTKLKTYKHCKDIKVKKYIFAIWYQDGKIEIIDEKLHSECINDNYELLENDCLSDNILLYNKGRFSSNLCIYIRKYRFIKYLNINSKNIIWNNNVGGFSVNNNKLIFNEYGKIIQSDIKNFAMF
ncbi:hypothetical protein [Campylobacter concisus]|uniref:Uncharacterized protein n=1 Tax=Campylobacter concisus TaxID=199 RepID=A0A7S9RJA1_9BACT|nr:hypothetical protein [Campylobacter concisus]QPH92736.1 hypothetical protein CVT01_09600 [Campylobacter concisus]